MTENEIKDEAARIQSVVDARRTQQVSESQERDKQALKDDLRRI